MTMGFKRRLQKENFSKLINIIYHSYTYNLYNGISPDSRGFTIELKGGYK